MKLKLGGADSIRVDTAVAGSSHVSVKSKKSSWCVQISSLIKKDLLESDLIFRRAIFPLIDGVVSTGADRDCVGARKRFE